MLFRLATEAIDDLEDLTRKEAERSGWDHSMDIEAQLWSDFELLGRNPGIGHLRPEITPSDLYFYHSKPYMIVYRRDLWPIAIVAFMALGISPGFSQPALNKSTAAAQLHLPRLTPAVYFPHEPDPRSRHRTLRRAGSAPQSSHRPARNRRVRTFLLPVNPHFVSRTVTIEE